MTASIRGFAFDAFGTLVTPVGRSGPYQRLATLADAEPRLFRVDAMTRNVSLYRLATDMGQESVAAELEADLAAELDMVRLYPDAADCLSYLDREGIPYVVCSNLGHGYGARVRHLVSGARGYVMSYEVGAFKPDPRMYAAASAMLALPPEFIFFSGDTIKADVEGPLSSGMNAAHLDRRAGDDLHSLVLRALSDAGAGSIVVR